MKKAIAYNHISEVFKNKTSKAICLNAIQLEQIYDFSENLWNKLFLKIKCHSYSRTDQANLSVSIQYTMRNNI